MTITFGTAPVTLPEPLAGLVRELAATRRGHAAIGHPGTVPWLFPGGCPGQPLSSKRLGNRLKDKRDALTGGPCFLEDQKFTKGVAHPGTG
jgi:hypothetical protein